MAVTRYVIYILCVFLWVPQLSFCASSAGPAPIASDITVEQAKEKIKILGKEAIDYLIGGALGEQDRHSKFVELYQNNFDQQKIASLILGRFWDAMNETQKANFLRIQPHRLANIYSSKFREWENVQFRVLKAAPVFNSRQKTIVVTTRVQKPGGSPLTVYWYMNPKGQIFDINVDGISMLKTFRDQDPLELAKSIKDFQDKLEVSGAINQFLENLSAKVLS